MDSVVEREKALLKYVSKIREKTDRNIEGTGIVNGIAEEGKKEIANYNKAYKEYSKVHAQSLRITQV